MDSSRINDVRTGLLFVMETGKSVGYVVSDEKSWDERKSLDKLRILSKNLWGYQLKS